MSTWGHGQGRLTADKCRKLQNYFHGAILGNKGKPKEMEIAIWASLFHCTSTDTDLHHGHCPDGENSWCFYKKAQALGEQPGPHADNLTTDISREVAQQLLPLYRRMSCNTHLSKVLQGKTQNNGSLNSMIWAHCPKTVFVGKRRIDSAVATAVCKFIRGNLFLAELMDTMLLQPSEFTINILEATDVAAFRVHHQHPGGHRRCSLQSSPSTSWRPQTLQPSEFTINILEATDVAAFRVHHQHPGPQTLQPSEFTINILGHRRCQTDKAAEAQFAACRRHRHVQQAAAGARQEDQEGEVYGAGMMADH